MNTADRDAEQQRNLYEWACRRMAELVPGWSDAIPSDPSVAILELAAGLSALQQRRWAQTDPAHYRACRKLLGGKRRARTPAALMARPLNDTGVYGGQRFWVDGVPYEAEARRPAAGEVSEVWIGAGPQRRRWEPGRPLCAEGETLRLEIVFTRRQPAGVPVRLWCGVEAEPGRVPPNADTEPPLTWQAEAGDENSWRKIVLRDETCGLLQSGFWNLTADRPFSALRVTARGSPEGQPRLRWFVLEPVWLEQCLTRSAAADLPPPYQIPEGWMGSRILRYFLPAGDGGWREAAGLFARDGQVAGWTGDPPAVIRVVSAQPDFLLERPVRAIADEEISLEEEGVLPERLRLMVREGDRWYDCPLCEPDPARTLPCGCRWVEERRALCFGDGRDYRVPADGAVLLAACAVTRGREGNGAAGLLRQADTRLMALAPAAGGCDRETEQEAFLRTVQEQDEPLRAVTLQDYEQLARQTPGLALGQVHALAHRAQAGVTVLAKPLSPQPLPTLTPWQTGRLRAWLERYRMIGVPVRVQSPRYMPLAVTLPLRVSEPVEESVIRAAVLEQTDGVRGPREFGAEVSGAALFAALGRLEHVIEVTSLELRPLAGGARRAPDGTVRLKPDMLPWLKQLDVTQT